jgi:isocitrate lyase
MQQRQGPTFGGKKAPLKIGRKIIKHPASTIHFQNQRLEKKTSKYVYMETPNDKLNF